MADEPIRRAKAMIHLARQKVHETKGQVLKLYGQHDMLRNSMVVIVGQADEMRSTLLRINDDMGDVLIGARSAFSSNDNLDRRAAIRALGSAIGEADEVLNRVYRMTNGIKQAQGWLSQVDRHTLDLIQNELTVAYDRLEAWNNAI